MGSRQQEQTYTVGVLGATGTVGQRFITLLTAHPFLRIHALGASERSAGKTYIKATKWKQSTPCHDAVKELIIKPCEPSHFTGCDIIFSGLDHDVAGPIETAFRAAHYRVFTNAKNYRRDPQVPLLVPTANPDHIHLLRTQQQQHRSGGGSSSGTATGFIVANSNCSTAGLVVPMAAIHARFPDVIRDVHVVTMQAISGAGYPGVASLDILDNVVPHIGGEEEKMEWETGKILGTLNDAQTAIRHLETTSVTASCNRVPVIDGHLACVTLIFAADESASPAERDQQQQYKKPPTVEEIIQAMLDFKPIARSAQLPSAPRSAIHMHYDEDRPQPRLDREIDAGYAVSVGRVRPLLCSRTGNVRGVKFVTLVHNTVLGAAGMGILNAELAIQHGYIQKSFDRARGNL